MVSVHRSLSIVDCRLLGFGLWAPNSQFGLGGEGARPLIPLIGPRDIRLAFTVLCLSRPGAPRGRCPLMATKFAPQPNWLGPKSNGACYLARVTRVKGGFLLVFGES
eukprot:scaffold86672_cov66-Cyclotella_meneghiniana.AAC.1